MRRLLLVAAPTTLVISLAFLLGCTDDKPKGRLNPDPKRIAVMELQLSQAPKTRSYKVGAHELMVVDLPVQSGRVFVERQRCFVWRDSEFRTASMSCEADSDLDTDSLDTIPP
jgi:hypothetical protein